MTKRKYFDDALDACPVIARDKSENEEEGAAVSERTVEVEDNGFSYTMVSKLVVMKDGVTIRAAPFEFLLRRFGNTSNRT